MSPIKSGEKTAKEKPPGVPSQVHRQLRLDLARLVKKFDITNDLTQEKNQKYINEKTILKKIIKYNIINDLNNIQHSFIFTHS